MPSSACKTCDRSEEHTSELQSHDNLVCRLLLEKKDYSQWILGAAGVLVCGRFRNYRHGLCWAAQSPSAVPFDPYCTTVSLPFFFFFFLKIPATPEISPLSPHSAFPF